MANQSPIIAWHGDAALKAAAVARMREHAAADRLIRGDYLDLDGEQPGEWRGCLHGCLTAERVAAERGVPVAHLHLAGVDWHAESERLWGIPRPLGVVLDRAYERSVRPAGELAVDILEAIPVGVDLGQVVDRLMLDLLDDPDHGVWLHTVLGSAQQEAVDRVAALHRRRIAGNEPTREEWAAAEVAAWAAARGAAWAAWAAGGAGGAAGAAAWAAWDAWTAAETEWQGWWEQRILHHLTTAPLRTASHPPEVTR